MRELKMISQYDLSLDGRKIIQMAKNQKRLKYTIINTKYKFNSY